MNDEWCLKSYFKYSLTADVMNRQLRVNVRKKIKITLHTISHIFMVIIIIFKF